MTTTAQKKGPAAAVTAPDHGSTNPGKEMEMNAHTHSMSPSLAPQTKARCDLETELHSLLNMTRILGEMLDDHLVEYRNNGERIAMPKPGGHLNVRLGFREMDMLSFAWNDVINRARKAKERYDDLLDAEAGQ